MSRELVGPQPQRYLADGSPVYAQNAIGPSPDEADVLNQKYRQDLTPSEAADYFAQEGIAVVNSSSALGRVLEFGASVVKSGIKKAGEAWRAADHATGGKLTPISEGTAVLFLAAACAPAVGSQTQEGEHKVNIPIAQKGAETTATSSSPTETVKSATATPTASPSPEPTATPQPEAKGRPCAVLRIEDCPSGELVYIEGDPAPKIGFNLSEDAPLFAVKNGQLTKTEYGKNSKYRGYKLTVEDANNPGATFNLIGDIDIGEFKTGNTIAGAPIGTIKNRGIKNSGYNLLISAFHIEGGKSVPDEALLKELFPWAFNITAKEVAPNNTGPVSVSKGKSTPIFTTVPPPSWMQER